MIQWLNIWLAKHFKLEYIYWDIIVDRIRYNSRNNILTFISIVD